MWFSKNVRVLITPVATFCLLTLQFWPRTRNHNHLHETLKESAFYMNEPYAFPWFPNRLLTIATVPLLILRWAGQQMFPRLEFEFLYLVLLVFILHRTSFGNICHLIKDIPVAYITVSIFFIKKKCHSSCVLSNSER